MMEPFTSREEREESRRRILEEVQRLHREILNCAHCQALKDQIGSLYAIMPPKPVEANGHLYEYIGPWLASADIDERLRLIRDSLLRER